MSSLVVPLGVLRALVFLVTCGGLAALVYVVLCAPSRPPGALGVRGLKRQRALQDPMWNKIEPAVRWLGERLSGALSDKQTDSLDRQLVHAGDYLGLTPPEYMALIVLAFLGSLTLSLALGQVLKISLVIILAFTLLGAITPYLVVSGEATRRQKWVSRRLPSGIDLIALAMSAGLDFPGAVRQVVEKSSDPYDPLIEELGWILHKLSLGRTRRQALEEFATRVPVEVVLEFVGAVAQAEERGHPVAGVLQVQARQSRQHRSVRAEEAAAKAGVALALPLILMFITILILIIGPVVLRVGQSALFKG
ncbi:MAG TPA: type II secretion system F family protein [Polyangiaceae bacterium]|jgi:tight adherence protein C|nr:type II secretion system F family protein [Polyangiaceae bacterium]